MAKTDGKAHVAFTGQFIEMLFRETIEPEFNDVRFILKM